MTRAELLAWADPAELEAWRILFEVKAEEHKNRDVVNQPNPEDDDEDDDGETEQ